jgi:hypothetical protein
VQDDKYVLVYNYDDMVFEFRRSGPGLDQLARCLNLYPPTVVLCVGEISDHEVLLLRDRCFGFGCVKVEDYEMAMLVSVCKELVGGLEVPRLQLLAMGARGVWIPSEKRIP